MKLFRGESAVLGAADARTFAGTARSGLLASDEADTAVRIYRVEFESGARTNWHTHSGPQWLLVVNGRIRVQRSGEPAQDLETGDAALIAPGERHWHGAVPGEGGAHLAVNVNVTTTWLEPVTDADYLAGVR